MNVAPLTPFLIVSGAGILALLAGLLPSPQRRWMPTAVSVAGLVAAGVVSAFFWGDDDNGLSGNFVSNRFSILLTVIFLAATLATLALAWREPSATDKRGEYAGLLMLAASGMILVAGAGTTIVVFLGIELFSVALYVLCAIETWRMRSLEAGLKYLIVGAVGSAVLLYGLALLYGATGTVVISDVQEALTKGDMLGDPLTLAAIALILVGLGFKSSAVPFHMWTPDVYDGAPTPITSFMATATKAAAFAAFVVLFSGALIAEFDHWKTAVAIIAAVTMVVGNVAALLQTGMKRMLAYSGIAQAGYLLIGLATGTADGVRAMLYYLIAYVAMTTAAFALVVMREREIPNGDDIASFAGYGRRRPVAGIVMTISMLSLAGFPPLAGFVGKFLLFSAAIDADLKWLAIVGALASVVSLGYYLRVVGTMWSTDPVVDGSEGRRSPAAVQAVAITGALAVIVLAVVATPVLDLCRDAALTILPLQ